MEYEYREDPGALPPYMQLKLVHAKEDIAAKVTDPYLERLLSFELFTVRQLLEEAEREQSMELARKALTSTQDLLHKAEQIAPLRYGRNSRTGQQNHRH